MIFLQSNVCLRDNTFLQTSQAYQLLKGTEEKYLAAGLKLPIVLQYNPGDSGRHQGEIKIYVDDKPTATVPIEA